MKAIKKASTFLKKYLLLIWNWIKRPFKKKTLFNKSIIMTAYNNSTDGYITISMENKSESDFNLDLFSFSNLSLPEFIKVKYCEVENMHDFLCSIKNKERSIFGARYIFSNIGQACKAIGIKSVDPFGRTYTYYFRPLSSKTAYQNQEKQIDAPTLHFPLNDETRINITLLPNSTSHLLLQVINSPYINPKPR